MSTDIDNWNHVYGARTHIVIFVNVRLSYDTEDREVGTEREGGSRQEGWQ